MSATTPIRGYRELRKGRVSLPHQAYLVTTVCHDRESPFANPALADVATEVLSSPLTWPHATVQAWVLMPDHWHGLIVLAGGESLSRVMQRTKSLVTQRVREAGGARPSLWQRGFHDHALRREESVTAAARYILENPVRAGLVGHWSDWRCRGGVLLETLEPGSPLFV